MSNFRSFPSLFHLNMALNCQSQATLLQQPISRNVWENIGIRQPKNLLQNNRTLLHLTHFTSFCNKLAIMSTKRTCFFNFWYLDILGHFGGQKGPKMINLTYFGPKFDLKTPKNDPKCQNIKNPKNKFSLYS